MQTGRMPSSLIEPTGMAPGSGDETLSPLRGLRNDDGERVAGLRDVLPGPVDRERPPARAKAAAGPPADRAGAGAAVARSGGALPPVDQEQES
jgi:hypothetical protein